MLNHDRTQVLAVNYNWKMPFRRNFLVKGWQLSGITRGQTGAPFTPGYTLVNGADITGSASQAARLIVVDPTAPAETTRFRAPARGEVGNLGSKYATAAGIPQLRYLDVPGNQTDPLFMEPVSARPARKIQLAMQLRW